MNPANQLRLQFMFNSYGKLFISGNTAKGVLKVFTLNDATIERIKVGVIGKIILEDRNDNPKTIEKVFYCSEEHIFESSDLMNNEHDEQLFEFEVPLENNLPPSIMLEKGGIVYHVYATMEEMFPDETTQNINTEANISIVNLVDCNSIPKADRDKCVNRAHATMCMCLQNVEQGDSLLISPRAFVPGDCIKINASVFNSHSYPLCFVQAALVQKVKLKFEEFCMKDNRVVSETKRGCVMPQMPQMWDGELLRIPPLPPTTYNKHLTIAYKLELRIPGRENVSNTSALLTVPVVIGNIPLDVSLAHLNPVPRCESFETKILPIKKPYQEYARGEQCKLESGLKYVPFYITYVSERAMDNIDLEVSTSV